MPNLGERLRKVREGLGLDQTAFGVALGIASRETISRWERGLGFPSANILIILRKKYGININWLISGEGDEAIFNRPEQEQDDKKDTLRAADPMVQILN